MSLLLFSLTLTLFAQIHSLVPAFAHQTGPTPHIETVYDGVKNKTTVRLSPVQISGEKDKYHSINISPSFSYPGRDFKTPEIIDFEVQTVVKTKLKLDLYVVFVVDGITIFLSSNRSGVKRPVPGKRWVGERLVFRMPYDTLMKIRKATSVAIKMDGVRFPIAAPQLTQIQVFAAIAAQDGPANPR